MHHRPIIYTIYCLHFRNVFLNSTSGIHAKIMHIYMFWTVFGQIVQMMMHHLHDRVCIFCFLSILVKNGTYTQCKTAKPVSKHAHFVTDRLTHSHTHTRTNILKFEALLHKRPFGQLCVGSKLNGCFLRITKTTQAPLANDIMQKPAKNQCNNQNQSQN